MDEDTLAELRDSVNKGWALGSDRFRDQIEAVTERRAKPALKGGRRKGAGRPAQGAED